MPLYFFSGWASPVIVAVWLFRRADLRADRWSYAASIAACALGLLTHESAIVALPLLWLTRQLSRRSARLAGKDAELRVVPVVNGALRGVLKLERLALRAASLPFGSSLLAIARRPS